MGDPLTAIEAADLTTSITLLYHCLNCSGRSRSEPLVQRDGPQVPVSLKLAAVLMLITIPAQGVGAFPGAEGLAVAWADLGPQPGGGSGFGLVLSGHSRFFLSDGHSMWTPTAATSFRTGSQQCIYFFVFFVSVFNAIPWYQYHPYPAGRSPGRNEPASLLPEANWTGPQARPQASSARKSRHRRGHPLPGPMTPHSRKNSPMVLQLTDPFPARFRLDQITSGLQPRISLNCPVQNSGEFVR